MLGPLFICLVACLAATIGYLACIGTPGIFPILQSAGCWGGAGNIWGYTQYIFPVLQIPQLTARSITLTLEVAQKLFETVMTKILPIIVEVNLVILVMAVLQIGTTVVLAKAFAEALGAEGQIYGIGRLI